VNTCMHVYFYVCVFLSVYAYTHAYMYACMHACRHVCVHARVSVVRVGKWVGGVAERQIERVGACGWVGMCVCAEVHVAVCVVARHTRVSAAGGANVLI